MRLEDDAHLSNDVSRLACTGRDIRLQIIHIRCCASAAYSIEITRHDFDPLAAEISELEDDAIDRFALVPNLPKKHGVVRKDDELLAHITEPLHFVDRLTAPKRVLAGKRIVEDNHTIGKVGIAFEVRYEKCERERAAVARAERIPKARSISRCLAVSKLDLGIVDYYLVCGARNAASIC